MAHQGMLSIYMAPGEAPVDAPQTSQLDLLRGFFLTVKEERGLKGLELGRFL